MARISDKEVEHALMPSSGLRMGKSTLYKAFLDLRDARDRISRLEAALKQISIDKCEDNPAAPCYKGFTASGGWCNPCTAKAALEADDGE